MKVTVCEFDGTPEEFQNSPVLAALFERLGERAVRAVSLDMDPDADDAAAEAADAEAAVTSAPDGPDAIPGVPLDGQVEVGVQLDKNAAADLFRAFLAETSSWNSVKVIGIKPRRSPAGAPLDYTRYLRVRRVGSQLGAFVYVTPSSGLVEPRLSFPTDDELHDIAPGARRHDKGHREYRVVIEIVDQSTLEQALKLARLAYDRT